MKKFERLGLLIREKRRAKNLTQLELSSHFGYASSQFVSNWERGECGPPIESLPLLCKLLGISQKEIVNLIAEETKRELDSQFAEYSAAKASAGCKL